MTCHEAQQVESLGVLEAKEKLLRDEAGLKSDLENPEACLGEKTALLEWMPKMIIASVIFDFSLI